jgi:hypothetical protein
VLELALCPRFDGAEELMKKEKQDRLIRPLLGAGALFIALGLGNILFGGYKAAEYGQLLARAQAELERPTKSGSVEPFQLTGETDKRALYVAKLRNRVDLYDLAVTGGNWILGCGAGLLAAAAWLIRRRRPLAPPSEAPR